MATYLATITAVQSIFRRPEYDDLARRKINAAIRTISASAAFPQDLEEVSYTSELTAGALEQHLTLPDRTRKVDYVSDPAREDARIVLQSTGWVLHNPTVRDIAYVAGNTLHMRLRVAPTTLLVGVYTHPAALEADEDTNWVLDTMQEVVIDMAVSYCFTFIGETELAARNIAMANQQLQAIALDLTAQRYGSV